MLLFGLPGGGEWILIIIVFGPLILLVFRLFSRKKQSQFQAQGQQQQTHLNIHNYSVTTELEKLNELKEKGVLTQEEFDAQKKKLLSS